MIDKQKMEAQESKDFHTTEKIMQKIYHKMTDEEVAKYRKLIFGE